MQEFNYQNNIDANDFPTQEVSTPTEVEISNPEPNVPIKSEKKKYSATVVIISSV